MLELRFKLVGGAERSNYECLVVAMRKSKSSRRRADRISRRFLMLSASKKYGV